MGTTMTVKTEVEVADFIAAVEHKTRHADAVTLDALFRKITGWRPRMWGPTIIGYGEYHYVYDTGHEGDCLATGFSPRKANLVLYIMPGYQNYGEMLDRLGKHKLGKACLYINKLADIDIAVLEEIIRAGLTDLAKLYPVKPS